MTAWGVRLLIVRCESVLVFRWRFFEARVYYGACIPRWTDAAGSGQKAMGNHDCAVT